MPMVNQLILQKAIIFGWLWLFQNLKCHECQLLVSLPVKTILFQMQSWSGLDHLRVSSGLSINGHKRAAFRYILFVGCGDNLRTEVWIASIPASAACQTIESLTVAHQSYKIFFTCSTILVFQIWPQTFPPITYHYYKTAMCTVWPLF